MSAPNFDVEPPITFSSVAQAFIDAEGSVSLAIAAVDAAVAAETPGCDAETSYLLAVRQLLVLYPSVFVIPIQ